MAFVPRIPTKSARQQDSPRFVQFCRLTNIRSVKRAANYRIDERMSSRQRMKLCDHPLGKYNIFIGARCRETHPLNNLNPDPLLPANDPYASRAIVNVPIKASRYRPGPRVPLLGEGVGNVDVINFPFRSSLRFAMTDGKKRRKKKAGVGQGEGRENRMPRLGQAGVKASFQRSHCPRGWHKGPRDIKDESKLSPPAVHPRY